MILILSAYINIKSPPPNPSTTDQVSFVFAIIVLFTYGCFILLVIPYILLSYWKIPSEERNSEAHPEFAVIVKKLNLKSNPAFFLPVESILYRTVLCFLLLGTRGFVKSGVFLLLTFGFATYIAWTRPFDGNIENKI